MIFLCGRYEKKKNIYRALNKDICAGNKMEHNILEKFNEEDYRLKFMINFSTIGVI